MNRRTLIRTLLAAPLALALHPVLAIARTKDEIAQMQARWADFLPKGFVPPEPEQKLTQTEAMWREKLSPEAFAVLREEGTERPGSSPLNDEKRPVLNITLEEAKKGRCTECLACEIACWDEARNAVRIELPIPGLPGDGSAEAETAEPAQP